MHPQQTNELQLIVKGLGYFRTHWWVFVLEVIAIYSVSLYKFHKTAPVYESSASILIDTSRRQLYQSMMMTSAGGSSNARRQNMAQLLTSQEVMERFRSAFSDYFNTEGRPSHLRSYFPGGSPYPVQVFKSIIALSWDRNSDIYNIRCQAANPLAARDMCQVFMNTIQGYYPEIGQRESMMKRDFLSRQIASLTRQISERELKLAEFQKRNEDFFNFIMMNVEEKGLQRLRTERTALKQKIATNRAIFKLILSVPRAKRGEHTARSTAITALTTRISELEYQIQLTQSSDDTDKETRLARIREELAQTQAQLGKLNEEEVGAFIKNPLPASDVRQKVSELDLEYRTDLIKLESVETEIDGILLKEKKYNQQRMEYDRLLSELNHKKKLLTNLYQKEQETELELSAGNAEVFRLQEATLDGHRVEPQLSKHFYGGLSLSVFFMLLTAVALIAFFPRIDSEAEVHKLNLPVLGKIPVMRRQRETSEEIPPFAVESLKIMNYRILRETKEHKCPIIIVTSGHAREGKSTVTNYLMLASQNPSRKCLLIDGDLLTSRPNRFFGLKHNATPGVKAALDNADIDANSLIIPTKHAGLFYMPRGERTSPAAIPNLLKPVEKMLDNLRKEYDVIFIDTPPLFASNLAHQWAGVADLIVIVARLYSTRLRDIMEAIQTCKIFSKAPVGLALNCVPLTGPIKRASNYYFTRKPTNNQAAA